MGTRASVIWLTGLSGSGKSTIAEGLRARLATLPNGVTVLDGDLLRRGLCSDLGFSPRDRKENVRRAACVAALLADAGVTVIVALISPFREGRESARQIVGGERFFEVYVDASLDECEARDAKGLYARARRGEISDFTGISSPYEPPLSPDLSIATPAMTVESAVDAMVELLGRRRVV